MDFTIVHPDFRTQLLVLRAPGYVGTPSLWLNGVAVRRQQGCYTVLNDLGMEVSITLQSSPAHRIPRVLLDDVDLRVTSVPGWHQFAGWQQSIPVRWLSSTANLIRRMLRGAARKPLQG